MAWIYLLLAGLLEIVWAVAMKYSQGFSQLIPSVITIVAMLISFFLLSLAMKQLPLGTAYGVWVGIGVIGTAIIGIVFLKEPVTLLRSLSLLCLIVGVVGLKLTQAA